MGSSYTWCNSKELHHFYAIRFKQIQRLKNHPHYYKYFNKISLITLIYFHHNLSLIPKKKNASDSLSLSLSLSLSTFGLSRLSPLVSLSLCFLNLRFSLYLLLHCSSTSTSTGCRQKKKKENKKTKPNTDERKFTTVFDGLWVIFPQCQTRCFSAEVGLSSPTSHSAAMETWALPTHCRTR